MRACWILVDFSSGSEPSSPRFTTVAAYSGKNANFSRRKTWSGLILPAARRSSTSKPKIILHRRRPRELGITSTMAVSVGIRKPLPPLYRLGMILAGADIDDSIESSTAHVNTSDVSDLGNTIDWMISRVKNGSVVFWSFKDLCQWWCWSWSRRQYWRWLCEISSCKLGFSAVCVILCYCFGPPLPTQVPQNIGFGRHFG